MGTVFIIGCSFSTPLLSRHDDKRTILIQKAPIRLYFSGQFENLDAENINTIIKELDKCKYYNYNFDKKFSTDMDIDLSHTHSSTYNSSTKVDR
jgi:hypothetical protein